MKKDLKLPAPYKTFLMLALVFGPFFWLAFTEDGQRRTDLALMFVLGKPEFNAALDVFSTDLTEARLRETFSKLEWQCADGPNPFGDRLCGAEIGSFNQIPASALTLFFQDGHLSAAKLVYRRAYHEIVRDWVEQRLAGRGETPRISSGGLDDGVLAWSATDGMLFMREGELADGDEPALLWLSREAIQRRG